MSHEGAGAPWITVAASAAIPLKEPIATGYRITRTMVPVEARRRGQLSRGDIIRVHLDIEAEADATWVVVDDPIPAGASHIGTGLARDSGISADDASLNRNLPDFVERPASAFRAYYAFLPKGKLSLEYTLRLNQTGRFHLPDTRVEALYAPEMFGELPNGDVEVAP
jgi:uncharacterized protein YfaS (alpha-2-macroglobulin family)